MKGYFILILIQYILFLLYYLNYVDRVSKMLYLCTEMVLSKFHLNIWHLSPQKVIIPNAFLTCSLTTLIYRLLILYNSIFHLRWIHTGNIWIERYKSISNIMIVMNSKEEIECQIYSMVVLIQKLIYHERLLIVISLYVKLRQRK